MATHDKTRESTFLPKSQESGVKGDLTAAAGGDVHGSVAAVLKNEREERRTPRDWTERSDSGWNLERSR